MKSPGPFYQDAQGQFLRGTTPLDADAYRRALQGVAVQEVTGRVDFEGLAGALAGAVWDKSAEDRHAS
jgi:hypothetical protein